MSGPPVRVLVVSTTLSTGGAQRVTSTLLRHFDRTRIRPALCLMRPDIGYAVPEDVPIHCLEYDGLHTFFRTARRLRQLVSEWDPHVLLSNVNATNLLTGWALRDPEIDVPWIARMGNSPVLHDRGLRRVVARVVYPHATRFVANSHGLAGEVAERYPISSDRLDVIANPTDFEAIDRLAAEPCQIERPERGAVVIAVGRLFRQKRYDLMLEAFSVVRRTTEAELWICGDGPERGRLMELAQALGIEDSVRWLGFVSNPYAAMRQADVFLMTSDHEGLPNALIEAQGLGLPAVSTACPHGPDEIVEEGVTGMLVRVGDVAALADSVSSLLDDGHRRCEMGKAARSLARRRFDKESLLASWESLLLVAAKREPKLGR